MTTATAAKTIITPNGNTAVIDANGNTIAMFDANGNTIFRA